MIASGQSQRVSANFKDDYLVPLFKHIHNDINPSDDTKLESLFQYFQQSIENNDHNELSTNIQKIGKYFKLNDPKIHEDSMTASIISTICAIITQQNYTDDFISLDHNNIAAIMSVRLLLDCIWCLTTALLYRRDDFVSSISVVDICIYLLNEIEIYEKSIASSILNFMANLCSSEEDRNYILKNVSIDLIFSFIVRYEGSCRKEVQHLLHNIFRFQFGLLAQDNSCEITDIFKTLVDRLMSLKYIDNIMNCIALSSRFIDFQAIIQNIPEIASMAKKNIKGSIDSIESIDSFCSCIRFLGNISQLTIEDCIPILQQILHIHDEVYNAEESNQSSFILNKANDLYAAVCWGLYKSNRQNDLENYFTSGIVDLIFKNFYICSYSPRKYAAILLSSIACDCNESSDFSQYLIDLGIIQIISPFAKLNEKPSTQEIILSAIVALHQEEFAEDYVGDSYDELAASDDEKVSYIAQQIINDLNET